ncbi:MAG TPA: lytic transglycosylase domain-containing protein [Noviherbaspirillum sp.]|nr:lytic transglycosylase domain-containing protein [Noviherbaspirillum sp.]
MVKRKSLATKASKLLAGLAILGMLGGCSGPLPFASGTAAEETEQQAVAKPKRMRATTAKDILAEWGTFGLAHKPYRRGRTMRTADENSVVAMTNYNPTIQEIMANETCHACDQKPYHSMVEEASDRHGVPAGLIHAVIQKESGYNPSATSRRRARGLMQVTPGTGRFVGVENSKRLYDPKTNINAGTAYLKYLMENHDTVDEVLAAYNAGPGNVRKYNGVPPFSETRRYVYEVKRFYSSTSLAKE